MQMQFLAALLCAVAATALLSLTAVPLVLAIATIVYVTSVALMLLTLISGDVDPVHRLRHWSRQHRNGIGTVGPGPTGWLREVALRLTSIARVRRTKMNIKPALHNGNVMWITYLVATIWVLFEVLLLPMFGSTSDQGAAQAVDVAAQSSAPHVVAVGVPAEASASEPWDAPHASVPVASAPLARASDTACPASLRRCVVHTRSASPGTESRLSSQPAGREKQATRTSHDNPHALPVVVMRRISGS